MAPAAPRSLVTSHCPKTPGKRPSVPIAGRELRVRLQAGVSSLKVAAAIPEARMIAWSSGTRTSAGPHWGW